LYHTLYLVQPFGQDPSEAMLLKAFLIRGESMDRDGVGALAGKREFSRMFTDNASGRTRFGTVTASPCGLSARRQLVLALKQSELTTSEGAKDAISQVARSTVAGAGSVFTSTVNGQIPRRASEGT
jgi:hypothetical protein